MSVLRKALGEIEIADIATLIGARETDELEFKGTLPFKKEKESKKRRIVGSPRGIMLVPTHRKRFWRRS